MSGIEPLLSRRAALRSGAAASAVVLAGCGSGPRATTSPDDGPADAELLRRALARERRVELELLEASRDQPRLRSELQRLVARHRAHVEVLTDALPDEDLVPTTRPAPGRDPREVARALTRSERALADSHARAALQARSGPFARVLAGLAAAAEQQASILDGLEPVFEHRG